MVLRIQESHWFHGTHESGENVVYHESDGILEDWKCQSKILEFWPDSSPTPEYASSQGKLTPMISSNDCERDCGS